MSSDSFQLKLITQEDPLRARRHRTGQSKALTEFGVGRLAQSKDITESPDSSFLVQLILAETSATVGGARVLFRSNGSPLPTERNLGDESLSREIRSRQGDRPCEICELWIAWEYRGQGLLPYLVYAGIAAAHLGGARIKFGSTHEQLVGLYEELGISIDRTRSFAWPDDRYRTLVARIELTDYLGAGNTHSESVLKIAEAFERMRSFTFRLGNDSLEPMSARVGGL